MAKHETLETLPAYKSLDDTIKRREVATARLVKAVAHLPRDAAIAIVASWIPIDDLERMADGSAEI